VFNALDDHRVLGAHNQHDSAPITLPDSRSVGSSDQRLRPQMGGERIGGKLAELAQQSRRLARRHLLRLHGVRRVGRYDQLHMVIVAVSD
jgi:hypothetical protein